jgi:hypothetical protein
VSYLAGWNRLFRVFDRPVFDSRKALDLRIDEVHCLMEAVRARRHQANQAYNRAIERQSITETLEARDAYALALRTENKVLRWFARVTA